MKIEISQTYKAVGYFILWYGFKVAATKRPSWAHRAAMRLAFGWRWEPIERGLMPSNVPPATL